MERDVDSVIKERHAEAARRQRELDLFVAQTKGMEMARDMGVVARTSESLVEAASKIYGGVPIVPIRRGGRQPGAISQPWRNVLRGLYTKEAHGFDEAMVVAYALQEGVNIKLKDARDRMEKYKGQGFIESRDGKYFVTLAAAQKFGFAMGALGRAALGWGTPPP